MLVPVVLCCLYVCVICSMFDELRWTCSGFFATIGLSFDKAIAICEINQMLHFVGRCDTADQRHCVSRSVQLNPAAVVGTYRAGLATHHCCILFRRTVAFIMMNHKE